MKHIALVISALFLLVTESLVGQTTYDLPTGKSLEVSNMLPETYHNHFGNEQLAQSFGRLQPASDCRIVIQPNPSTSTISLMIILTDFNPDTFQEIFYPLTPPSARGHSQGTYALTLKLPTIFLFQLRMWYTKSLASFPPDFKQQLAGYHEQYYAVFTHDNEYLMIPGAPDTKGFIKAQQPITHISDEYGQVDIYPGTSPQGSFYTLINQGIYPLDPPWDDDGNRNTSWLVYNFFKAIEE